MADTPQPLRDIQDIRNMMERSSRFISLSGLSGIAAGLCALAGGFIAMPCLSGMSDFYRVNGLPITGQSYSNPAGARNNSLNPQLLFESHLTWIAIFTFIAAFAGAFFFTWLKSRKQNIPVWSTTSRRLMWNVIIPMIAGGIFLYRLAQLGNYGMIAPGCLVFYGLALLNASRYTLKEIRWLGFSQVILGILNCWALGYGLYFWMAGFGIMHIVYGIYMWWRYDSGKVQPSNQPVH